MPDTPGREPFLDALLESMRDAVLSITLEGRIASWSGAAERLYGYPAEEIIGQSIHELMPVNEVPASAEALAEAKRGTIRPYETTERLRRNGTKTRVEVRQSAIRNERNEITRILENAEDLNWRKSEVPEETQLCLVAQQMPGVDDQHGPQDHIDLAQRTGAFQNASEAIDWTQHLRVFSMRRSPLDAHRRARGCIARLVLALRVSAKQSLP
jgi:PAS domain S-box-containing protein